MLIVVNNKYIEVNREDFTNDNDFYEKIIKLKFNKTFPKQNNLFLINLLLKKI